MLALDRVLAIDNKRGHDTLGVCERIGRELAEDDVAVLCEHSIAEDGSPRLDQRNRPRIAVVDVGRGDSRKQRTGWRRIEVRGDVLFLVRTDSVWQERIDLVLVQAEGQEPAARSEEFGDRLGTIRQGIAAAASDDEDLVRRELARLVRSEGNA